MRACGCCGSINSKEQTNPADMANRSAVSNEKNGSALALHSPTGVIDQAPQARGAELKSGVLIRVEQRVGHAVGPWGTRGEMTYTAASFVHWPRFGLVLSQVMATMDAGMDGHHGHPN